LLSREEWAARPGEESLTPPLRHRRSRRSRPSARSGHWRGREVRSFNGSEKETPATFRDRQGVGPAVHRHRCILPERQAAHPPVSGLPQNMPVTRVRVLPRFVCAADRSTLGGCGVRARVRSFASTQLQAICGNGGVVHAAVLGLPPTVSRASKPAPAPGSLGRVPPYPQRAGTP
jgi:hypothetical protein